ncbi:zinc dependent phospholipase C family protein [Mucilaginibacter sp. KACC 22063]|uniref:zinc dependent phospholipase C family protein n=1 Tax=Mucilaginibacter sp. KACC 22063 TaxID=3025666 RepID=UPI002366218B|nr:zinc dependent phospholipase C family protein [Mucilaginibacter sp. KACC 22063]WDF57044.1 zinc dependent phospholipase C family protein [Mucilaginibacter sp. KACC 22063]
MLRPFFRYIIIICCCLCTSFSAKAYAILAHEAIVDACWAKDIKPLLLERYPATTDSAMRAARSYVYGGAMVADMGYLPMGSAYFSDLLHYVRSGEMVQNLIREAQNVNEMAFALGALSHYLADEYGHSRATNLTVPTIYKNLQQKYGNFVTYGDDNVSHSRTEFSYDVLQIARGNYNTQSYHDFIGFNVSKPVLERAFRKTYGEDLNELFSNFEGSVKTFRWGVKNLMPTLIRRTWKSQHDSIMKRQPGMTAKRFKYKMKGREFHQEYGKGESKPGFWASFLSWVINAMPKIGPLKTLKYVDPGQQGEQFFIHSFDTILVCYSTDIQSIRSNTLQLKDIDFDTGRPTNNGEYGLADQTYAELLISLQKSNFRYLNPALKAHLLEYYKNEHAISYSTKYPIDCDKLMLALQQLKNAQVTETAAL